MDSSHSLFFKLADQNTTGGLLQQIDFELWLLLGAILAAALIALLIVVLIVRQ